MSWLGPEQMIEQIPAWHGRDVAIVRQLGGYSNQSWLVRCDEDQFVLRLDSAAASLFPRDRVLEAMVHDAAARAGLAPRIVFAHPGSGVLVTEYVDSAVLAEADLASPETLEDIAQLLRRVHGLARTGRRFDAVAAGERYARALGDAVGAPEARRALDILAAAPEPESVCLCHNDIVAENILVSDPRTLIDWEYACDNDPAFDLASLIGYHDLDGAAAASLADAYAGQSDSGMRERLQVALRSYDALQWLWLAAVESATPGRVPGATERLRVIASRLG